MLKRSLARVLSMMAGMGASIGDAFRLGLINDSQRGNVATKKLNRNKGKRSGGRGGVTYRPGTLGVSAVSAAILKQHGTILSRKERRQLAKRNGQAFIAFYNKG